MAKVDKYTLEQHVKKLCLPNLKSSRVKCCAVCPFESIIVEEYPDLKALFIEKRKRKVENDN